MTNTKSSYTLSLVILGALFFIFGFVTWVNGILIPYLKIACQLNDFQSMLVTFAFYISYFVMALPSSWLLQKTGLKNGMVLGLVVMAIGALIFIPAAWSRQYLLFLLGLFTIGTGLSVLQTASNPYITIIGSIESAAQRISLMGISNKLAGVLAPIILGAIILGDGDTIIQTIAKSTPEEQTILLNNLANRVVFPYTILAVALVFLAFMVKLSPLPEIEVQTSEGISDAKSDKRNSVFAFPNLVLGVLALFLYVGVEVLAGDTIINYGLSQGIAFADAKNFTSYTLTGMVIGYIIGIFTIPKYLSQPKALLLSAVGGILFSVCAILTSGYVSVFFIAILGLANSLIWPAIWPLAITGLGKYTKSGSALLIMAIAGGAILPLIYGRLAIVPSIGLQNAYWILVPSYALMLFYSVKGYKLKNW